MATLINGIRSSAAIAELASADLGRSLGADQVRYIITAKLLPLGLIAGRGAPAAPPTASPLLALRARGTLLPESGANVVAAAAAAAVPLARRPGRGGQRRRRGLVAPRDSPARHRARQLLRDPATLLIVFVLSVASAAFHECGHATACRYGGARPGKIGAGIYLVWPSFFTNVTDSYRLSRAARLRTDLGGLYFNLIFILGMAVLYEATRAQILLLVIAVTHLEMLQQLLPFVRFDGYFILSDIVGVPDLFARVTPIIKRVRAKGRTDPRVAGLRRGARIAVTSWVLCVVPLLTIIVGYLLICLPQINRALWRATVQQARLAGTPPARPPLRGSGPGRYRRRAGGPVGRGLALHRDRADPAGCRSGPAVVGRPPRLPPRRRRGRGRHRRLARRPSGPARDSSVAGSRRAPHLPRVAALA